jgi:hypothetical protein
MMSRILFISFMLISGVVFNSCKTDQLEAEIGQKTSMKITKVFDAGERIKGEKIYAEFQVENTGRYPLVFGEIKGSCSCTVAEKPEAPILPGRKGVIKAVVDTEKFDSGYRLNKIVTVMANTVPDNIVKLKIIGTIK